MVFKKIRQNQIAVALADYVLMLGIAVGGLVLASHYYQKGIQGKMKEMTDAFIGQEQEGLLSPLNISGGRQLAEQGGLYAIKGVTDAEYQQYISQQQLSTGARGLLILESQRKKSPGEGLTTCADGKCFSLSGEPEYELRDYDKVPFYLPAFVRSEEGFVEPP
jgi:hypothetical protein